ncbi:HlyD family efflux transporter periplasmic adaptor subunit [Rhizobiaceae bacterium BDR2-2]|uniref:HlyD family efflux transporter periplasmic adaptor subunit n=1 Tax=Ectorhizobium quercum TaxID=2965071 RepID=A0AAE3N472_9HYPH|nr:HlyD family efflux transporter periplasmic adaptor subunit [Ectorhizobium quercum]MCX8999359.1 HlyD family efflux transporter periplasmic adaptor subunit [Ectorhizobium quercum]
MSVSLRNLATAGIVVVALAGAYFAWQQIGAAELPDGIAMGNGRIEATEIDISTKLAGRLKDITVREGDFVTAGQVLAVMDTDTLEAQKRQAEAQLRRAKIGIDTAGSLVNQRLAENESATAVVAQREVQLDVARKTLDRAEQLAKTSVFSQQVLDDTRSAYQGAVSALAVAKAELAASEAGISAARAQVIDAESAVDAAQAAIEELQTQIDDSTLKSPRDGRIQYRVAQPGEVLAAGGRVLSLVDLEDVYITFFLPTEQAGRMEIGSQARIVLDTAPQYTIPASISFVADVAQFTPRTVETQEERQKLVFRIRATIPKELLQKYIRQVKTGLPGAAYVRTSPDAAWPEELEKNLVQ